MNAFTWMEQQLQAVPPGVMRQAGASRMLKRDEHARMIADEIEARGHPMTRSELMAFLNLSRSSVRKACEAGEAAGILKQIPDRRPEAGLMTLIIDIV